ncbi:DgyrCDS9119 [Dimorphilus gyrociliatus]|nr:DgyrCDS9119 [Dimorphilus gyrociliatus]
MAPSNEDKRKKYILVSCCNFFGVSFSENIFNGTKDEKNLMNFLDDSSSAILFSKIINNDKITFSERLDEERDKKILLFFKTKPESITPQNMHQVLLISSMLSSPISSFYHSLKSVFAPLLLTDSKSKLEPTLEQLVTDLQDGLGANLRRTDPSIASSDVICSPADEIQYWNDAAKKRNEQAEQIQEVLHPVAKDLADLDSLDLEEISDTLDECQDVLDDLWKQISPPYPEKRMRRFLEVITDSVTKSINRSLTSLDVWHDKESNIRLQINLSVHSCDAWIRVCSTLFEQFWNRFSERPWKGEKYIPQGLVKLKLRLRQIITIRSAHEQLKNLLSDEECKELGINSIFVPFSGLNPVKYNSYTEPLWNAAVDQFNRLLEPGAVKVVGKLRRQLESFDGNLQMLMKTFQKYKPLVEQNYVKKIMLTEREALLGKLEVYVKENVEEFQKVVGEGSENLYRGNNQPLIVAQIVWCTNFETKFQQISENSEWLLSDLNGFDKIQKFASKCQMECQSWRKKVFDDWCRRIGDLIDEKDSDISLETKGRAMKLGLRDGKLKVNFGDRLVTLLREVKTLGNFGYVIPSKIQTMATTGDKYYKQAIILKQIAHFYNTIDDQMLKCQQALMLDSAVAFERLIKNPKLKNKDGDEIEVTWDQPSELEEYIKKLQNASFKLIVENRKLRKYHFSILDKISALMSIDLLKQQAKWKEYLMDIRQIFASLLTQGYPAANMRVWKAHLDRQLYKSLEHQYLVGLETVNDNLQEIHVDLVFKSQKLQFRPCFEEVQARYYKELKKFLGIPNYFKGFGDEASGLFSAVIDRAGSKFIETYRKSAALFSRLREVIKKFEEWVVFGTVDLEDFLENHLTDLSHFENNLKALKAKGRASEKLPSEVKVGCILINTSPVKMTIEEHMQRLYDEIVATLRRSVSRHAEKIEKFLTDGMELLGTRPQTVQEIGEANAARLELCADKKDLSVLMQDAESRNKLLRQVAGGGVDSLGLQKGKWDKFELMIESHQLMIKDQLDVLKSNMKSRITDFEVQLEKFAARWKQFRPTDDVVDEGDDKCKAAVETVKEKRQEFKELLEVKTIIDRDCHHFEIETPEFSIISELETEIAKYEEMWNLYDEFSQSVQTYANEDWVSFRSRYFQFDELLTGWNDKLKTDEPSPMIIKLRKMIDSYKQLIPQLKWVRGEPLTPEHWAEFFSIVSMPKAMTIEKLTFGDIISATAVIIEKADKLKELNLRAQGEISIRDALKELDIWGASAHFALSDYEDTLKRKISLIKDWKDLLSLVGDNQSLLQSLKDSPYYKVFEDKASIWEVRLACLDECLHNLNQIQRKWVYLEPIFSRGALPKEQGRFKSVDTDFRGWMKEIQNNTKVLSLVDIKGLGQALIQSLEQLHRCQKSLNELLEEKRGLFPRFYFIGDDDMLEILGQSTNPQVIQAHLKKLFSGIHSVQFDETCSKIIAMKSLEGEIVPLNESVKIVDAVEVWLSDLAVQMKNTLKDLLVKCLDDMKSNSGGADPLAYPSQILSVAEFVRFTGACEKMINGKGLKKFHEDMSRQLESYTNVDISEAGSQGHVLDLKLKSLILDCIHNIDVIEQQMSNEITSIQEWQWQKQLRYYMKDDCCIMRMVDAEFDYTYEYQGNAGKLVHTPLTDKCYLTLTQAMSMGMGGNPYGPAGTGKTESVKALGGLFGRQVLVFNCDEGIDVQSMGRIFIGLVKCGAWGCFDEFNRLDEAVLSAVSMQIQVIQDAIKIRAPEATVMNKLVDIDHNAGIFITLNPAGKGYGGRSKLPDNLKQLFRPVAMSKPDNDLIAEVTLFSEGYKFAKSLGRKVVAVFNLSKELLTPQQHYDWGLRSLKTILRGCGSLLQNLKKNNSGQKFTNEQEATLCVQALRINTLSKLTFSDAKRFEGLLTDVFPGVNFKGIEYEQLEAALKECCNEMGLDVNDTQIKKCLELFDQLSQRMGVVVVGPSGSGKSTLWKLLQSAMGKTGTVVKKYVMNPKAMPRQMLLGNIDMDTREWSDGVLTWASRQVIKEPNEIRSWVVCDGDIDPEWIESLNSVLDDNRLLTMPSGERIQFGPNANFLFECHDLSFASPATVSRMGMIFISDEDTDVRAVVSFWLKKQPQEKRADFQKWIDQLFFKSLDWILKNARFDLIVEMTLVGIVLSGLSHLHYAENSPQFAVCLIKGFGSNLPVTIRETFAKEIFDWIGETPPDPSRILDTYYDTDLSRLSLYSMDQTDEENSVIVKTSDVKRTLDCVQPWVQTKESQPFILVGPEGCGKTLLLQYCFDRMRSTQVATLFCSAQTGPEHVIQKLTALCTTIVTNTGKMMKPKDSENLVLYLKDLNLPKPDKYGTCMLISFLQSLLLYKGFYDENLEFVGIEGILIAASMNASGMGRHKISTRYSSIVRVCSIDYPDKDQLEAIYAKSLKTILSSKLPKHPIWSDDAKLHNLASAMIELYEKLKSTFSVDDYSHYSFTPRHLTAWLQGLHRYNLQAVKDQSGDYLLEVWAYEAHRLFRDRIVGEEAKKQFDDLFEECLKVNWDASILNNLEGKYFTTFAADIEGEGPGKPVPENGMTLGTFGLDDFNQILDKALVAYSRDQRDLELVIFKEVYEAMSRVNRVLTVPGGSLLLAGRSGIGRRTALVLVSHMQGMTLFSPKVSRSYGMKQFKLDLKTVMQQAGIDGDQVVLLLEDHQLVHGSFLEMINSVLAAGEIPGLYTVEELDAAVGCLKEQAIEEGYRGTLPSLFAKRVRSNLHVVLIMDCSNATFSLKLQSNPAILKECTVIWMDEWSSSSMISIPHLILTEPSHEGGSIPTTEQKQIANQRKLSGGDQLLNGFLFIHKSCQSLDATPRKFLAFVNMYSNLYDAKKSTIEVRRGHLQAGISKLNEAKELVDNLKREAGEQSVILTQKQEEADKALKEITKTMADAGDQKVEMEKLQIVIDKETINITKRKEDIDAELSGVEPLLAEAKEAVGCIRPESLNEIRALKSPPEVIRDILEGALRLMGIQDTSWNSMKAFLGKRGVTQDIVQFDARKIPKKARKTVEDLLKKKERSFDPVSAKKASQAAAPLANWVRAQIKYANVIENIEPLENEQNKLQSNLAKIEDKATKLKQNLAAVDEKVANLKATFERMTSEATRLKIELEKAEETIAAAESLVGKLQGEYDRWSGQVGELKRELDELPLRAIIGAGFVTYLSNASEDCRTEKVQSWMKFMNIEDLNIQKFLSTESEQLFWKGEGLPSDNLSLENAMVMLKINPQKPGKALRPFMIDPSSRATEWLKTHMKNNRLEVINQQDSSFGTTLELSVRFGKTLLITEADGIEPLLYPILRGDLIQQGPRFVVQIGDKVIDYNEEFKIFLTTRNPSPELAPDASSIVTIVNFTTTKAGLTGQLLAATIQHEKPELEVKKTELLKAEEKLKIELEKLEASLLEQLANAKGNILENKELLDSLNKTKESSTTISKSLAESKELQIFLDKERGAYLPLAEYASEMFFVISDLFKIDNMYRFSLNSFLSLFNRALDTKDDGLGTESRISTLKSSLLKLVYNYVSRSLFKADRLMFAIHMVHGMFPTIFEENEWEYFIGILVVDTKGEKDIELPDWVEKDRSQAVLLLKHAFPDLFEKLSLKDLSGWSKFARSAECEDDIPSHIDKNCGIFQHLLTISAIRPDRLQSAMTTFACKALSMDELSPPNVNLKKLYEDETSPDEPILIIISTGADPSQDLEELAKEIVGSDKYFQVAMGQGQAEIAMKLLKECSENGSWLCLKNLHLVTSWLGTLEKSIKSLKLHPNFRLWFTAESHPKFPPILLQSTLKITYEAPPGVKKNLLRTYEAWGPSFISAGGNSERSQAMFVLAWFHSVMSERRNFLPQGWTKFYEFSFSDLRAGAEVIDRLFKRTGKGNQIPWNFVHGLMENAIYGGRVDNIFDQRVLKSFLLQYFNTNQISPQAKANRKLG